jgi:hypothetical protein
MSLPISTLRAHSLHLFLHLFEPICYFAYKLIPVKNQFVAYLSTAIFCLTIFSCSDLEKSSLDKPVPEIKERKEEHVKAKKIRKKIVLTNHRKTEVPAAKIKSNEAEEPAAAAGNSSIMNILAKKVNNYAIENGYSTEYCFLVDMSIPSGRKRFFVYDLQQNVVVQSGLVAHGSCNETFLSRAQFSNAANCGCSSLGKYKVGEFYRGKYGRSFRLYGLDNSNSNAYKRAIVIHGYGCVPDKEIYPMVLCNSLGCVMVSPHFFETLSHFIEKSGKPIVLWLYE